MPLAPAFGTFGATTRESNETRTPPDKERFLRNNLFLRELFFTKKLEFASALPGDRAASSVSWSDRALRRKFISGASATGPVS